MPTVLLATFNLLPEGESGGAALVAALADHGVDARWACWDDPSVDWGSAELVAVRSTWDYHRRLSDFLAWARGIERHTQLLNGAEVFAWNADKAYLRRLPVPTVPTELLDDSDLVPGLTAALARWGGRVLVKPRTGAGGVGVVVAEGVDDPRLEGLTAGPWVVQPVVESVRTVGESSVFVIDGRAVAQVDKSVAGSAAGSAAGDEVRVHELYGGSSRPVPLDPPRARLAEDAVRAAAGITGADLSYARVDQMRHEDRWVVSEVELIEPGLYLDVDPGIAGPFVAMVRDRLASR